MIKENIIPFVFLAGVMGLLIFPIWSHVDQGQDLWVINGKLDELNDRLVVGGEDTLVGASTLFAQNASVQLNLAFYGEIKPDGITCSDGEILKKTGANDWDCAADSTGVGGKAFGWLDMNDSGGTFVSVGSLSFDASHFTFSNTASLGYLRLDWGAGGPASLSEAETIAGNWVNTANPWADNEVTDALTVNGGTVTWTDLTSYPTGCTNQFVTTVGDTLTCATATDAYVDDAITASRYQLLDATLTALSGIGGSNGILAVTGSNSFTPRTLTGTTNQITVTNGDGVSGNPTFSIPALFSITTASLSGNFEVQGYASASAYYGKQVLWSASIASTSNEFQSGGRIPLPRKVGFHYIITEIYCAVDTGTSIVINASNKTGTYDTETVTCDLDGASDTAIGTNPSYATGTASSSLEMGTITGDVDWLDFTIYGFIIP